MVSYRMNTRSSHMRSIFVTTLAATLIAAAPAVAQNSKEAAKAEDVLRAAREALGGADRIAAIRTLVATGKHRRTMGETQVNGETEIAVEFPDKYLRAQTDQIFGNSVTLEMGFNGEQPLQHSSSHGGAGGGAVIRMAGPGGAGPGGVPPDPEAMKAAMLRAQRADFARIMLGWLATAPDYLGATFSYAGEAESPDGRADVIEIKGQSDFAAKLFIDQATHRPLMLTYMGARPQIRVVRSEGPRDEQARNRRTEEIAREAQAAGPPPQVEMQVYFDDYRKVGGVWLPHRISRAANGEPSEELEFEKIRVNEPIKPSTFDVK